MKKKTGLLRVYYESLSAHIFTSTRKNTLILSPVPLEAWLLLIEASPADIRKMCVCPPALRKLRTYDDADSQTMPVEHPPTPPPCRWPALITLPTLAKSQPVWCLLCEVVLFRSACLFEHTLTAVCALSKYQSCRKYHVYSDIYFVTI